MTNGEKIPAPIAQAIDAGGKKAQYDAEAKQFLSNVEILSRIMKRVVPEFKGMELGDIKKCILKPTVGTELLDEGLTNITGENTESNIPSEGYVTFDIKFSARADSNPRGKVILDMEMQRRRELPYPIESRGIFYCARMISSQKTREFSNSDYGNIRKVYSIWLLFSEEEEAEAAITSFSMQQENEYGEMEHLGGADLLEVILIRIPQNVLAYGQELDGLIRMLGIVFSGKISSDDKKNYLEEDYGITIGMEDERRLAVMCNLSEGFWEAGRKEGIEQGRVQGIEQGIEQGRMQGIEQGMEQGIEQNKIAILKNALKMGLPEEQIQKLLGISVEEMNQLKQELFECV